MEDIRKILFVDNKENFAKRIVPAFKRKKIEVFHVTDIRKALRVLKVEDPQIVIQRIDELSLNIALRFVERVKSIAPSLPVIIVSDKPSIESIVSSLRVGASDYVTSDISVAELEQKIEKLMEQKEVHKENTILLELAALHDIALSFFSSRDLSDLFELVLKSCIRISKADSGSIMLCQNNSSSLKIEIAKGVRKSYLEKDVDEDIHKMGMWVCSNKRSLLITDGKTSPQSPISILRDSDSSSLCIPLYTDKFNIGVINLNRRSTATLFTRSDLTVMEVLAKQASIAIANAKNYETVTKKIVDLKEIQLFGENLIKFTDSNSIINFVITSLIRVFDAHVAALIIPSKRNFELHICSKRKMSVRFPESIVDVMKKQLSDKIQISSKRVRVIQSMSADSKQSFLEQKIVKHNSYIVCPLLNHNKWIGAIYIGHSAKKIFDSKVETQLSSIAHQTCISLMNARLYEEIKENHLRTIKALAIAVDAKDTYTRGHSENVMKYAVAITEKMGILDEKISEDIQNAALLHDIGKIGIPGSILNKPEKLTYEEFNGTMKNHSRLGANIIQEIPFLNDIVPLILHHHERYDGKGYPSELTGENIPVGARILTVADSFEAMTSDRPYRKSLSKEHAVSELINNKGTQFDPFIVDVFVDIIKNDKTIM